MRSIEMPKLRNHAIGDVNASFARIKMLMT